MMHARVSHRYPEFQSDSLHLGSDFLGSLGRRARQAGLVVSTVLGRLGSRSARHYADAPETELLLAPDPHQLN